jgi:hypothetical protein
MEKQIDTDFYFYSKAEVAFMVYEKDFSSEKKNEKKISIKGLLQRCIHDRSIDGKGAKLFDHEGGEFIEKRNKRRVRISESERKLGTCREIEIAMVLKRNKSLFFMRRGHIVADHILN